MKKFFEVLFTALLYITMAWGEFGGLYHTYTRHRDDTILAFMVPPVAWYRSIEFFWHKEYSGKRWEETKKIDTLMLVALLSDSQNNEIEKAKLTKNIEALSKKILKYPQKKKEEIKSIFNDCARYHLIMFDDFSQMMSNYKESGALSLFKSGETIKLEQKLESYGLKAYIASVGKSWEYALKQFEDDPSKSGQLDTKENWQKIKNALDFQKKLVSIENQRISEEIFK